MRKAFVLMTAMPPTTGHLALVRFAAGLPVDRVTVIVATQPGEPYCNERYLAMVDATSKFHSRWDRLAQVDVVHLHRTLPQDPATPGFWDMWYELLGTKGFLNFPATNGDFFVTSEPYGAKLAELTGATFIPYDPNRELIKTKATLIRENPYIYFNDMIPEFQRYMKLTITFWGAESTGKTTLSKEVAGLMDTHWLYEWARPYLETVGPDINIDSMTAIWYGQKAAQKLAQSWTDKPYLIQDTDLFSTVGYWEQPHWQADLGPVSEGLVKDAYELKSDLYIITRSNIDFEADPLRYGGDHRESPDSYWISIAEKYNLPYMLLNDSDFIRRRGASIQQINTLAREKAKTLAYDRKGL